MSTTLQAADWSVYQRPHTYADMITLKDAGIELIIPGAWHGGSHNPNCRKDLQLAREAGLYTGTYAIVTGDGRFSVDKAYEVCGPEWEHLRFCAIDMELAGGSVFEVQRALDRVRQLGQEPIIYTAYWFWHDVFGNPEAFRKEWLWNAYYDQQPDIDFVNLPYGGWTQAKVMGEQYIGTHTFMGMVMDRSTFSRAAIESLHEENIPTPTPELEDEFMPYLAWDRDRQRVYLVGPWGASWITDAKDVDKFEEMYGKLAVGFSASTLDALNQKNIAGG